jgi:2-polyprenyl-3-methyl-5-hydroxy-6-metoxy-1,4-benzoquinol methylase
MTSPMNNDSSWHTNDEFWKEFAPFMFDDAAWHIVPAQFSQALKLMDVEDGSRFLDMACGPGRHSLELARCGFQVTGVDRTALYLEEAARRAVLEQLTIEFVRGDMRTFSR